MSTIKSVQRKLWAKAQYRASDMGFAPDCRDLVEGTMEDAARRLSDDGFLSDQDQVAIAEANIERFISEMMLEARRLGYNELHEDTFAAAKSKLCPLWPIC
ncbi:MAG: hypothetical protein NPINA01_12610 [Nitrospinaceae bacterium]|nr:MAG: hypothetical protein NPINA01_12610 [Nitrospinaceae bacterium]